MNTNEEFTPAPDEGAPIPTDRRPLGAWLRLTDALIAREFADAFAGDDVSRRDWMLLNALSGTVDAPWLAARLARRGKHLRRLVERGWVVEGETGEYTLTDEGNTARERLSERVQAVRAKVVDTIGAERLAELTASLEDVARGLGWDESQPMPRGGRRRGRAFGPGRGFGPHRSAADGFPGAHGFGREHAERHGLGPGWHRHHDAEECAHDHGNAWADHGFGPGRRGFGPGHHDHLRAEFERRHHGGHEHRHAERAYERGFIAGFAAARQGETSDPAA